MIRALRRPAAATCLGWVLGLGLAHAGAPAWSAALFQMAALGGASRLRRGLVFCLAASAGLLYGDLSFRTVPSGHPILEASLNAERELRGTVRSVEATEEGGSRVRWACPTGAILLHLARAPAELLRGDWLEAKVRLSVPEGQLAPGAIDRDEALSSQGLELEAFAQEASRILPGPRIFRWIPLLAARLSRLLRAAPVPRWIQPGRWAGQHGAFLDAILLGRQDALSPELAERFRKSGLYHLFAISGMNLALIAALLYGTFGFLLGRRAGAAASMAAILLYAALVGDQPSVDRAALMVLLHLGGIVLGRRPDALNSVFAATALLLLWEPAWIAHLGFQLTVLATLSVLLFAEPASRQIRLPRFLAVPLGASVAAQAGIFPLLLLHFREISVLGILSSLAAAPLFAGALGLAMVSSFVVCLGVDPHGAPVTLALLGATACTEALFRLADVFASLPSSVVQAPRLALAAVPLYFAFLGSFLLRPTSWTRLARVGLLFLLAATFGIGLRRPMDWPVRLTFLGVGNADAALLELPHGRVWMIDGAGDPRGKLDVGSTTVLPFLREAGIDWIETIYLSHAHPDHALGLFPLLQALPVDRLRAAGPVPDQGLLRELREAARTAGVDFETINPFLDARYPLEENDRSLVLRFGFGHFSALFPGDVERASEHELVDTYGNALASVVLKVPHHGSCTSSWESFLDAVRPRLAIVSVGAHNPFGHPCPEAVARLQAVLGPQRVVYTSSGSVRVSSDGVRMLVEQYQAGAWLELGQEPLLGDLGNPP